MVKYLWEILVQLDILANVILGGKRHMTISERAAIGRTSKCSPCRWTAGFICWFTDLFDDGHCDELLERNTAETT